MGGPAVTSRGRPYEEAQAASKLRPSARCVNLPLPLQPEGPLWAVPGSIAATGPAPGQAAACAPRWPALDPK